MAGVIQDKVVGTVTSCERASRRRPADGWIVATSATLAPNPPEKILVCTQEMVGNFPEEYSALRKAILAGCQYCESAANQLMQTGALPLDPSQRKRCLEAFKD